MVIIYPMLWVFNMYRSDIAFLRSGFARLRQIPDVYVMSRCISNLEELLT